MFFDLMELGFLGLLVEEQFLLVEDSVGSFGLCPRIANTSAIMGIHLSDPARCVIPI
jgi:hypothetical protein